jgi:hypothetical protein
MVEGTALLFVRWFVFGLAATAFGCGGPEINVKPAGDPDGIPQPPNGRAAGHWPQSSMQASTTCAFAFTTPPTFDPNARGDACLCSRRPGAHVEGDTCQVGIDWGTEATIGPEGGLVRFGDTPAMGAAGWGISLQIPPSALAEPTTIRIIETSLPPPAGFADWSPVYAFEPAGLTFATPASVWVPYQTPSGAYGRPSIYWSSEADTCLLETRDGEQVGMNVNLIEVSRLGWAVVGHPLPPSAPSCP